MNFINMKYKNKLPLISIITVVLNGEKTIENAIKSVLDQKFSDYEYIIVDGYSSDKTTEIIKKYKSKLAFFISEPDEGLYDAMNKAIKFARGHFIYFLGADDTLLNILDKIAPLLKDKNTIYYGNVYRPKLGNIYDGEFSSYKLACKNICHQSIFYPRHVLKKNDFDLRYPVLADYDLNIRLFYVLGLNFQYVSEVIAIFMDEGGVSQNKYDEEFEKGKLAILKLHISKPAYFLIYFRFTIIKILEKIKLLNFFVKIRHMLKK